MSAPTEELTVVSGESLHVPVTVSRPGAADGAMSVTVEGPGLTTVRARTLFGDEFSGEVTFRVEPTAPHGPIEALVVAKSETQQAQVPLRLFIKGAMATLDRRISGKGFVRVQDAENPGLAAAAATLDGKLLVVGTRTAGDQDFALRRFGPDGALDSSFGAAGKYAIDVCGGHDRAEAATLLPDGRAVVVGSGWMGETGCSGTHWQNSVAARITANGELDESYGVRGLQFVWFKDSTSGALWSSEFRAVAALPDGRVILAGLVQKGTDADIVVFRLTVDGQIDLSFGEGGIVWLNLDEARQSDDVPSVVQIDPKGKILIGATSSGRAAVIRLTSSGQRDSTFGTNGVFRRCVGAASVCSVRRLLQLPDGKLQVIGTDVTSGYTYYARLLGDGTLDPTFAPSATEPGQFTNGAFTGKGQGLVLGTDGNVWHVGSALNVFSGTEDVYFSKIDPTSTTQSFSPKDLDGGEETLITAVPGGPQGTIWTVGEGATGYFVARFWL